MQEEIGKYRFANSIRWLTENVNDVDHMLELGGWYGTIAHSVSRLKQFKSYVVYEAVTEIAKALQERVPAVEVRNECIAHPDQWKPTFWMDSKDTVSTSGLFTPPSKGYTEFAVGPCVTVPELLERHKHLFATTGFKSNIEGMDLDVVDAICDLPVVPKFMLFEIFGRERPHLWQLWPKIASRYNLNPEPFTDLTGPVLHIGVAENRCCWWTVLPNQPTAYNIVEGRK